MSRSPDRGPSPRWSGYGRAGGRWACGLEKVSERLVRAQHPDGYWEGYLSSSALSTATALSALALGRAAEDNPRIQGGANWLFRTQNADGGWGDTVDSPSNLSTTLLAISALRLVSLADQGHGEAATIPPWPDVALQIPSTDALAKANGFVSKAAGARPCERIAAVTRAYGEDRTFAVPILMNGALAGLFPWDEIPDLPFELAALPGGLYRGLRLQVVSYALPALIAIGLLLHRRKAVHPTLRRWIREAVAPGVLAKLARLQPPSGGFLEAIPLTSFVAMSLLAVGGPEQPVARKGLDFLRRTVRPDGSWPIDANLSVWLTSSAVNALAHAGRLAAIPAGPARRWLADRQGHEIHPFTGARPGGWPWTHLPGGVPDADDTAGALLALHHLGEREVLSSGVRWLLDLQNADGGWPTFCRGWNRLPFDRSAPDVSAHVLLALHTCGSIQNGGRSHHGGIAAVRSAIHRGLRFLATVQRSDGSWIPLWFGNQSAPEGVNAVLGTARVVAGCRELGEATGPDLVRGARFLVGAQNADGGWGGGPGLASTIEETALAVTALGRFPHAAEAGPAAERGAEYLCARMEQDRWGPPAPIGLYFARLWYSEELYRDIWAVQALGTVLAG